MLIAREFVAYLSRQVVRRLTPAFIETSNPQAIVELTTSLIIDELEVEDRLNDEVRDILGQYSDYMRQQWLRMTLPRSGKVQLTREEPCR